MRLRLPYGSLRAGQLAVTSGLEITLEVLVPPNLANRIIPGGSLGGKWALARACAGWWLLPRASVLAGESLCG